MVESNINIGLPAGIVRLGRITKYDVNSGKAKVKLANVTSTLTSGPDIEILIPNGFYSDDGLYIGGLVKENTPIAVTRGEGGDWYFISFLMTNSTKSPTLVPNQLLIQSSPTSKITLDTSNNINIGSDTDKLHFYINKNDINDTLMSSTFDNNFNFTEATRSTNGIIKRETTKLPKFPSSLKLKSDDYTARLYAIGLDPTLTKSPSFIDQVKNPPFAEQREMVYEFGYSYNVQDDLSESQLYKKNGVSAANASSTVTNRRQSRADTLSLSLVAPNYLMETVKGTVVDIFGNILDLNRVKIPIGSKDLTIKTSNGGDIQSGAFDNIKAAERKSIAYHFELNARKNLNLGSKAGNLINLLDINSSADYSRNRSRFFFDIDKEGQFKLNVPASSETGNVPLLARYENYSTYGTEEDGNPNKLVYREDNVDIFLDSFSTQNINIMDGTAIATPIDRISGEHIRKGMPFHSITDSLNMFQTIGSSFLDFQYNEAVNLTGLPTIANVVNSTINVSGSNANAGGRSGSMHLDGSLELSVGANTVDRQSLWVDTAGGLIGNFGRDLNNVSAGLSFDGDLLIQVGGNGIDTDSRFTKQNNAYRGGVFDIRVLNDGFTVSIIRIDKNGISIATPNTITLKSRDINISAEGTLTLEGDNIIINERFVAKFPPTSI